MADIKNGFYKNNNTLQAVGTAAAGIADTAFENPKFKRGLYDMADPLYYLAGNRESKVGNAMSDTGVELFKSGASSGNPWLMLAGGISKGVGSLVNAAWGHGEDKDNINRNNSLIAKAQGINILDSSSDGLMYSAGLSNLDSLRLDRSKFTNGWWNHDGTKAYNNAFGKMTFAQGYNDNKINNGVNNFAFNQFSKAVANSNAYGGPIMGATDYSIMQDYITLKNKSLGDKTYNTSRVPTVTTLASGGPLFSNGAMWDTGITFINNGGTHEANPYEGVQMGMDPQGIPNLVEEGEVVWNDYVFSNRLKVPKAFKEQYKLDKNADLTFADAAKKFSEEIEERPNDPISKAGRDALLTTLMDKQEEIRMVKEARKQAKQQALMEQAIPEMMAGNPYAVPQEMAMQEGPEEYENSNNDLPEGKITPYAHGGKLGNLYSGNDTGSQKLKFYETKSDIEAYLPWLRDMYVKDGNTQAWDALFDANNKIIAKNNTGLYDPNGAYMKAINSLNAESWNKWTPEQQNLFVKRLKDVNPNRYENLTINDIGTIKGDQNLSWEQLRHWATDGMVGGHHQVANIISDINNTPTTPTVPSRNKASRYWLSTTDENGNPVAQTLKDIIPDYYEGISTDTGLSWAEDIAQKGYIQKGKPQTGQSDETTDYTDYFFTKKPEEVKEEETPYIPIDYKKQQTWMRYAPVIGSGIMSITDALGWTNKEDYTQADELTDIANTVGKPSLIDYKPVGNYLQYQPFDINYAANKLTAQSNSTRRALMNQNGPSRNASLLALDYNTGNQLGDIYRQAEEYNFNQRAKVEDFNRATNMFNSQQALTKDKANQDELYRSRAARASYLAQSSAMKQQERQAADAKRSANLTNFLQGLGDIGNENQNRNMLKALYATGKFGYSDVMAQTLFKPEERIAYYIKNNPNEKDVEKIAKATSTSIKQVNAAVKKNNKSMTKSK